MCLGSGLGSRMGFCTGILDEFLGIWNGEPSFRSVGTGEAPAFPGGSLAQIWGGLAL